MVPARHRQGAASSTQQLLSEPGPKELAGHSSPVFFLWYSEAFVALGPPQDRPYNPTGPQDCFVACRTLARYVFVDSFEAPHYTDAYDYLQQPGLSGSLRSSHPMG